MVLPSIENFAVRCTAIVLWIQCWDQLQKKTFVRSFWGTKGVRYPEWLTWASEAPQGGPHSLWQSHQIFLLPHGQIEWLQQLRPSIEPSFIYCCFPKLFGSVKCICLSIVISMALIGNLTLHKMNIRWHGYFQSLHCWPIKPLYEWLNSIMGENLQAPDSVTMPDTSWGMPSKA